MRTLIWASCGDSSKNIHYIHKVSYSTCLCEIATLYCKSYLASYCVWCLIMFSSFFFSFLIIQYMASCAILVNIHTCVVFKCITCVVLQAYYMCIRYMYNIHMYYTWSSTHICIRYLCLFMFVKRWPDSRTFFCKNDPFFPTKVRDISI